MTASELRLGNLILFRGNLICLNTNYELFKSLVDISRNDKRYKPIPLTEEWLLKFGFVTTQWDNFDSYRLEIGNHDYAIVIYSDGHCEVGDIIITKINYVHQLQNLYFALTGEELTLKSE